MKDDSNVTLFKPGKLKAKAPAATQTILLDDSSDDDMPLRPKCSSSIRAMNFDDAADSDEVATIAYTLAESTKALPKQQLLKNVISPRRRKEEEEEEALSSC